MHNQRHWAHTDIYGYKNTCFTLVSCLIFFVACTIQEMNSYLSRLQCSTQIHFFVRLPIGLVMPNEMYIDIVSQFSYYSYNNHSIFYTPHISIKFSGLPTKKMLVFWQFFFWNIQTKHRHRGNNIENYQFHNKNFFTM